MKIWMINQYNMPPEYGHLNRHYNFGKYLMRMGHEPTVFVGSFLHNTNIQIIKNHSLIKRYENAEYPYYFVKACDYSRSRIKRIYAMYQFYRHLLRVVKPLDKPDVIIGSSAHPLAALAAIKLGKKYNCQAIVEIRDLWPESIVSYGIISKRNPFLQLLYKGEKWIYTKADKLIFTMEGGKDYIIEKGWDKASGGPIDISKVYHINNGVDLEAYDYNKEHYQIDDVDLQEKDTFKVIYAGSIRLVNKVDLLLDTAKILKERGDDKIRFLIWGSGSELETLKRRAFEEGLDNVCFKGLINKKFIPFVTSRAQLNISLGRSIPLFKYGGSSNKMFDYFASGKPSLFTFKSGYSLIEKYEAGIELTGDSATEITEVIDYFSGLPLLAYKKYCDNARNAAKDYDFKHLTEKLMMIIEK